MSPNSDNIPADVLDRFCSNVLGQRELAACNGKLY